MFPYEITITKFLPHSYNIPSDVPVGTLPALVFEEVSRRTFGADEKTSAMVLVKGILSCDLKQAKDLVEGKYNTLDRPNVKYYVQVVYYAPQPVPVFNIEKPVLSDLIHNQPEPVHD